MPTCTVVESASKATTADKTRAGVKRWTGLGVELKKPPTEDAACCENTVAASGLGKTVTGRAAGQAVPQSVSRCRAQRPRRRKTRRRGRIGGPRLD